MRDIGCSTPFSPNKSNICTDKDTASKAYQLYFETRNNQTLARQMCPMPCDFETITLENLVKKSSGFGLMTQMRKKKMILTFKEFVKLSVSSYSYTILELIAEVGGYVGLFLGVSINQSIDILSQIVDVFSWIFSKLRKIIDSKPIKPRI